MLVEAAFAASRTPGPLRAFYRRVKDRRGFQTRDITLDANGAEWIMAPAVLVAGRADC